MKYYWSFLFWFLLIIFLLWCASIPALSEAEPEKKILKVLDTPPDWESFLCPNYVDDKQGEPRIVSFSDGAVYFCDGNSRKPLWSFSSSSSVSSLYQAFPYNDHREDKYPLDGVIVPLYEMEPQDGVMVPYQKDILVDIGDALKGTKDFTKSSLMKIVGEYAASAPHILEDELVLGATQNVVYVLDANNGSLIEEFKQFALPTSFGKNNSLKAHDIAKLYLTMKNHILGCYNRNSGKMMWKFNVTDIRATLHSEGTVAEVSVCHFVPPKIAQFGLDISRHWRKDINNNEGSTTLAIGGKTNQNSTSLAIIKDTNNKLSEDKKLSLSNRYIEFLRPLAAAVVVAVVTVVAGTCIWKQHSNQVKELKGKQTATPKRKKARKLGNHKKNAISGRNDEIMSPENGGNPKGYQNIIEDVKEPWFNLGTSDDSDANGRTVGKLFVSNIEIAKGSNGTVVLEGKCGGREVAVKRLVQAHHDVAYKEIQHLIASDRHPNIVRWYGVECDSDFVYLSLERCTCSLNDLVQITSNGLLPAMFSNDKSIESGKSYNFQLDSGKGILKDIELWKVNGHPSTQLLKIMREIVSGIAHLHELGIIHRDLKPQNILITKDRSLCAKISDMGISKRLIGDNSSLSHRPTGCGSSGWQAPEQLLHGRQTRAVDLFSLGCVLFFCMTGGKHPFGDYLERDINIVKNRVDLFLVEHIPEAVSLLSHLLDPNPQSRPTAWNVMNHPLFWSSEIRLSFLRDTSDRVELEDRENDSDILKALENAAPNALGGNWDTKMETTFISNIGRYRRYKFDSMRDLLRVMRNKLNHYRELPKEIQELLGPVPEGFNDYFASRFPRFLIEVYTIIYKYCKEEEWFGKYCNISSL